VRHTAVDFTNFTIESQNRAGCLCGGVLYFLKKPFEFLRISHGQSLCTRLFQDYSEQPFDVKTP